MPIFYGGGGSKTGYTADEFSDTKTGTFLWRLVESPTRAARSYNLPARVGQLPYGGCMTFLRGFMQLYRMFRLYSLMCG